MSSWHDYPRNAAPDDLQIDAATRLRYAVQIAAGLAAAQHVERHSPKVVAAYALQVVDALLEEANK